MLAERFAASARADPGRPALLLGGRPILYGELFRAASAIARHLQCQGIGRNDRVGLLFEKSFELYASVWGVWMAGAAYVPLAPSYPASRLKLIVERAEPRLVLREADVVPVIAGAPDDDRECPLCDASSPDLAYVLFTSGSTGTPKGVMVSRGNVESFVSWARIFFSVTPDDRFSGHSDLTFDLSVFDTFVPLTSGACLVPVTDRFDRATPGAFIHKHALTIWFSVPSVLSGMAAVGDLSASTLGSLRWMAFCGEPLLPVPVRQLMVQVPGLRVANLYGQTEATVACAAHEITTLPAVGADSIPFGWRTGGTEVFVWTDEGRVAGDREQGEVFIAGDQVASGYFRDAEETARQFVRDPRSRDSTVRCFRTGDIAEVGADGPVFRMRVDNQIKFRGWRIELGDVERMLAGIEGVVECAASLLRREGKPDALVAFVRTSQKTTGTEILRELRGELPEYMIPTHVRIVPDFPRTLNDKIDRARLQELF